MPTDPKPPHLSILVTCLKKPFNHNLVPRSRLNFLGGFASRTPSTFDPQPRPGRFIPSSSLSILQPSLRLPGVQESQVRQADGTPLSCPPPTPPSPSLNHSLVVYLPDLSSRSGSRTRGTPGRPPPTTDLPLARPRRSLTTEDPQKLLSNLFLSLYQKFYCQGTPGVSFITL